MKNNLESFHLVNYLLQPAPLSKSPLFPTVYSNFRSINELNYSLNQTLVSINDITDTYPYLWFTDILGIRLSNQTDNQISPSNLSYVIYGLSIIRDESSKDTWTCLGTLKESPYNKAFM